MQPDAKPRKTDVARHQLIQSRQALTPALRMLLITVDGRKTFAELATVARSLGLRREAFEQLRDTGLIVWDGMNAAAEAEARRAEQERVEAERHEREERERQARRLVRAKFFAIDLAARMLAGRDAELRERAREVDTEARFADWLEDCVASIERASDAERAALFRERVSAAALA